MPTQKERQNFIANVTLKALDEEESEDTNINPENFRFDNIASKSIENFTKNNNLARFKTLVETGNYSKKPTEVSHGKVRVKDTNKLTVEDAINNGLIDEKQLDRFAENKIRQQIDMDLSKLDESQRNKVEQNIEKQKEILKDRLKGQKPGEVTAEEAERFLKKSKERTILQDISDMGKRILGGIKKTVTGAPQFLKNALQDIPRTALRFKNTVAEFGQQQLGIDQKKNPFVGKVTDKGEIKTNPEGVIARTALGSEPIGSIADWDKKTIRPIFEQFVDEKTAKLMSLPASFALNALDVVPGFGGGASKISDDLVKGLAKKYNDDVAKLVAMTGDEDLASRAMKDISDKPADVPTGDRAIEDFFGIKKVDDLTDASKATKRKVKRQINLDKFDLEQKQIDEINERMKALGLDEMEIKTFADMENAARRLGISLKDIQDLRVGRLTADEVNSLNLRISRVQDELVQQEEKLANEALTAAEKESTQQRIQELTQQMNNLLERTAPEITDKARALASQQMTMDKTLSPKVWWNRAKRKIPKGEELTDQQVRDISQMIKQGERQSLAQYIEMLEDTDNWEVASSLWKAGLLTSPTTWASNTTGNVSMALLDTAANMQATPLDWLISKKTGKRTTTFSAKTLAKRAEGFKEGISKAGKFFRTGKYPENIMKKFDMDRSVTLTKPGTGETSKAKDLADKYMKSVFRFMGAQEIPFRESAFASTIARQAEVKALNEGLDRGTTAFKDRVADLMSNPTAGMKKKAINVAEFNTFTKENTLAQMANVAKSKGGATSAAAELVMPFTRTPSNIADALVEFSPAGLLKLVNPKNRTQEEFVKRLGRFSTGTEVMGLGYMLAREGKMTGSLPEDEQARADFFARGLRPNSLILGENVISLDRSAPLGNLLGIGAEFFQEGKKAPNFYTQTLSTMGEGSKMLTNQTFLRGLSKAINIAQGRGSVSEKVNRTLASAIPNVIGQTARSIDPTLRVPEDNFGTGTKQTVFSELPFLREGSAPARVDIFGEKVKDPAGRLSLFDPFSVHKKAKSQILDEAKRLDINIGMPDKTVDGITMTNKEFHSVYQKRRGRILRDNLLRIINTPEYQQLDDQQKKKVFERFERQASEYANSVIFPKIMAHRYNIPYDMSAGSFREVLRYVSKSDKFERLSRKKQEKVIKDIINRSNIEIQEAGQQQQQNVFDKIRQRHQNAQR